MAEKPAIPIDGKPKEPVVLASPQKAAELAKQAELSVANSGPNSQTAADTDAIDSVGKPKSSAPVGPRGNNAPRDSKPAPQKKADQTKVTVTDKTDSAGNDKPAHPVGIRGAHTVRDTYRL